MRLSLRHLEHLNHEVTSKRLARVTRELEIQRLQSEIDALTADLRPLEREALALANALESSLVSGIQLEEVLA